MASGFFAEQLQRIEAKNAVALRGGEAFDSIDHRDGIVFRHVERRVCAERHAVGADLFDQVAQRIGVMRERVEIKTAQQLAGECFV